jgi:hypothetical protein
MDAFSGRIDVDGEDQWNPSRTPQGIVPSPARLIWAVLRGCFLTGQVDGQIALGVQAASAIVLF